MEIPSDVHVSSHIQAPRWILLRSVVKVVYATCPEPLKEITDKNMIFVVFTKLRYGTFVYFLSLMSRLYFILFSPLQIEIISTN